MVILQTLPYRNFQPTNSMAFISVPQAHYAVAKGAQKDIGILATTAGRHLALAFVDGTENRDPKVVLGQIDSKAAAHAMIQTMLRPFGAKPLGLRAYLAGGRVESKLVSQVISVLEERKISYSGDLRESGVVTLAINLANGAPLEDTYLPWLHRYEPRQEVVGKFDFFAKLEVGRRTAKIGRQEIPEPIREAFNLKDGMPKTHTRHMPEFV